MVELLVAQLRNVAHHAADDNIQLIFDEHVHHLFVAALLDAHLHLRIQLVERGDDARQQHAASRIRNAETQQAALTGIDVAELVLHRGAEPLIALTVTVKNTPLVGQLEFRAALKQLTFQLFFERGHVRAERLLRYVQFLGGAGDAFLIGDNYIIFHREQIHGTSSSQ